MNELQGIESKDIIVFLLGGILVILLSFAFILYFIFSYRNKQKAYTLLELQKAEIDNQKIALEKAMHELQVTQNQLIQSEKLASLGELTAGIAHEIQNPLNFVNNFSEVSTELLLDFKNEIDKGDWTEAKSIADNVRENLIKINFHGKRADSIVRAMLQHSRATSSHKEPTDINALADEYLRLAYHGLRAKDKSFNAEMITKYDDKLPKILVIPQDIGRVLLNLFTNAFYATHERKKSEGQNYKPTIKVTTKFTGDAIEISVKDNGTGIQSHIVDKIFQPFFTTKPTGQGTGLGLSLAYDIIKAHGGVLKVQSIEKEASIFIILLPV